MQKSPTETAILDASVLLHASGVHPLGADSSQSVAILREDPHYGRSHRWIMAASPAMLVKFGKAWDAWKSI